MKRDKFLIFRKLILRKNNFLGILCLFAYLPCQADLIIRAGSTPFTEYAAWIATHPDDHNWIKQLENQHPSKAEAARIAELIELSQKSFLTGSLDDAKKKFHEIADQADSNDWRPSERQAITYSMLRFYQLEKSRVGLSYLKKAAIFGFDIHFDPRIFPPPIFKAWKNEVARAQKSAVKISNLKDFTGFDIVKIDGRSYSLNETESLSILPGEHRISFLASHAQYFTQKISSSQLQVMKLEPVIMISGTCENPIANSEIHFQFTALFEEACVRSYNGQTWIPRLKNGLDKLELQKASYKSSQDHFTLETASAAEPSRKWLWFGIGASLVTSLVLIYENNQNQMQGGGGSSSSQTSLTPTHRQGN